MTRTFDTRQGYSVTPVTAAADLLWALLDEMPGEQDRAVRGHARRWLDEMDSRGYVDSDQVWPYKRAER
jgi:hypothetical protein